MGAVRISFKDDWYQSLQAHANDTLGAFKDLIANNEAIRSQLQNYHRDEDGAPIVPTYEIISVDLNAANNGGQIRFAYHVEFTFACADKRAETKHTETSNFSIETLNNTLNIFIHEKISRDTFEEF